MLSNGCVALQRPFRNTAMATVQACYPISKSAERSIRNYVLGNAPVSRQGIRQYATFQSVVESDSTTDAWIEAQMLVEESVPRPPPVKSRADHRRHVTPFHEKAPIESRYDALLKTNSTSSNSPDYDWRLRSPSRASLRRSSFFPKSSVEQPRLKPRAQREKAVGPHVSPDSDIFHAVNGYREHFLPLLEAEKQEADTVVQRRLRTWPVERLESEGYCLRDMSGFWLDATSFGRPVAAFSLGVGCELPRHLFKVGDDVFISRKGPLEQTGKVYAGQVTSLSPTYIAVTFASGEGLKGLWRLDLGSSHVAFRRMSEAMTSFLFDPAEESHNGQSHDMVLRGTHLTDILLSKFSASAQSTESEATVETEIEIHSLEATPEVRHPVSGAFMGDMRLQSWCTRFSRVDPIEIPGDPPLDGLNAIQRRAIAMMLSQRLSLVQGPPGTGKTKTIIEAVRLLKVHFEVPQPILVCTFTNVAVDNLVEGLAAPVPTSAADSALRKRSVLLKPLRIGTGGQSRSSLQEHNLLSKIERHPLKPELDKMQITIDQIQDMVVAANAKLEQLRTELALSRNFDKKMLAKRGKFVGFARDPDIYVLPLTERLEKDIEKLNTQKAVRRSLYFGLYLQITYEVCHDADVICTTCIASACFALSVIDFPVVFLDEASMSMEPATLIPIMKGSKHLALIGDHKQLPPVIVSKKAREGGLGVSLFERLTKQQVPSIMLDTQYRMHPEISRFPSSEFYDLNLLDGTVDLLGNVSPSLAPPNSKHLRIDPETGRRPSVIFLNHRMPESFRNRSRANDGEAMLVLGIIEDLLYNNQEMSGTQIGVIAPYVAQTTTLRTLLTSDAGVQDQFKLSLGPERALEIHKIEVKTVDGFEGREKEVIIFSTVRNNEHGQIGFLADRRRLNVGLTRAKRALFVLGNSETLGSSKAPPEWKEYDEILDAADKGVWSKYMSWLSGKNLMVVIDGRFLRNSMISRKVHNTQL